MKKWATLLPLCLSLGCRDTSPPPPTDAASPPVASSVVAPASPHTATGVAGGGRAKCDPPLRCPNLNCSSGGGGKIVPATILYGNNSIVGSSPEPICVCAHDFIEWTYDNSNGNDDKEAFINDPVPFLDNHGCKTSKPVKKNQKEKAKCKVRRVKNGCYPYEVKGSHPLDPEVEVQGGNTVNDKSPSPAASPSP